MAVCHGGLHDGLRACGMECGCGRGCGSTRNCVLSSAWISTVAESRRNMLQQERERRRAGEVGMRAGVSLAG